MTNGPPEVSFSHLGIFVFDLVKMGEFYQRVLGFVETDRGTARGRPILFLSRDPGEHHQLVLVEGRSGDPEDRVVNQISFRVGGLDDLRRLKSALEAEPAVSDIDPVDHGATWSVYFRDPEGNRVELFVDTPWYVRQPRIEPLDLSMTNDEIEAATRRAIESEPGFQPIEEWRRDFEKKLAGER